MRISCKVATYRYNVEKTLTTLVSFGFSHYGHDFWIFVLLFGLSYGKINSVFVPVSFFLFFFEIVRENSIILTFELCYRYFESSYWFFTLSYQFLNSHTDFLNSHTDFWILMNVVLKERLGKWNKPMFLKVFETKVKTLFSFFFWDYNTKDHKCYIGKLYFELSYWIFELSYWIFELSYWFFQSWNWN